MARNKIINDPVYGFITISDELILDIIDHPYFQRLRRIRQLGLSEYVYPGANHTRFHHAIGAMHLMGEALKSLIDRNVPISEEEILASKIAILLHDIGHGPFSHALEKSILNGVHHETISLAVMKKLDEEFNGSIKLAIDIFTGDYHKKFLHQLVSSQLDIDRMDYLQRDCYFTGVSEGTIGADRIIKMIDVVENELVVEEKGIYSIENFLNTRRLMYWQVYLHKTAIGAEQTLIQLFKRAKSLIQSGQLENDDSPLFQLMTNGYNELDLSKNIEVLKLFLSIDDYDIWHEIKKWSKSPDKVLSTLSENLLNRTLPKVILSNEPIDEKLISDIEGKVTSEKNITKEELSFLISKGSISNAAYVSKGKTINIKTKKGELVDVAQASELPNIKAISKIVTKHYLCWPKKLTL